VLRGGAIGDFLLTLPALDALRVRWPDSHIELIGYPHIAALAVAGGLVNRLLSLDRSDMARLFARKAAIPEELAAYVRSFDIVLSYLYDPDGTLRDHLVSAGVRLFLHGTPLVAGGHAADHLMKPLAGLAIYPDGPSCPRLRLPPSAVLAARQRLAADGAPVVVLHPGSGGRAKRWPIEAFLCLAAALRSRHLRVTFLAGEADHDLVEPMATAGEAAIRDLPLTEVAAILAAADGYVGNDSGITHLAAAVGCRVVALFGGTDPAVWGPRGQNVRILRGQVGGAWDVRGIARDEVVTALGRCE
jgi:ADP-heptose:LPS heptosyltransferase